MQFEDEASKNGLRGSETRMRIRGMDPMVDIRVCALSFDVKMGRSAMGCLSGVDTACSCRL